MGRVGGARNGLRLWTCLVMMGMTTAGVLTALAPPVSASTGGVIKVAYQNYGTNITLNTLMQKAGAEFQKTYPGWTVDLEPIAAPEKTYYTKVDLMSRSTSTAPDVLYEDTFLVNGDIADGYLAPLGSYLSKWSGWSLYSAAAKAAAKGVDGQIYGVPMGTDTSGLWYNKTLLQSAGIAVPWQPKSWADILSAAEKIKKAEPGVIPINVYSGVGTGEVSSMQGFEMFLYGTNNPLYDTTTNKWEEAGAGWRATLNALKALYGQGLAASPQDALSLNWASTVPEQYLPQGKLAIDLDGSWVSSDWAPASKGGVTPWPAWTRTMGVAAMPTENGQGAGRTSMSGGWLLSVGSHATDKQMAFNFITVALDYQNSLFYDVGARQIPARADVAAAPVYKSSNASVTAFSSLVPFTHFRPAYAAYPKLSNVIQVITGQVITGQATPAQGAAMYNEFLISLVGPSKVEAAPQ
jgi:multiple sugar transport system substrate-binding protein